LKKVRENEVREGVKIALQLFRGFDDLEILLSWRLGFNVANNMLLAIPNTKVRVSSLGLLRLGSNLNIGMA
jgi:hypothetical protein